MADHPITATRRLVGDYQVNQAVTDIDTTDTITISGLPGTGTLHSLLNDLKAGTGNTLTSKLVAVQESGDEVALWEAAAADAEQSLAGPLAYVSDVGQLRIYPAPSAGADNEVLVQITVTPGLPS